MDVQDQVTREVCFDEVKEELAGKLGLEIDAETAKKIAKEEVCEMIEDTTVVGDDRNCKEVGRKAANSQKGMEKSQRKLWMTLREL